MSPQTQTLTRTIGLTSLNGFRVRFPGKNTMSKIKTGERSLSTNDWMPVEVKCVAR